MDPSRNNHHDPNNYLGINKLSRQIRKSPPPPAFRPPAPQPQVYNISKNDFRDIVQQLTGTPTRDPIPNNPQQPPRPPPPQQQQMRPHSQQSQRLQKIRPPPLVPMARPMPPPPPYQNPNPNRALMPSPVTAYMRYLESSLLDTSRLAPGQQPGLLPSLVGPPPQPFNPMLAPPAPPPPPPPPFPSPRLPLSPYLQSPSAYLNLLSPKSPYPLLSPPGFQYPPPLTPNLPLSPGILGPGPGLGPPAGGPPSPGFFFPNSPSGLLSPSNFFPIHSPRWRNG